MLKGCMVKERLGTPEIEDTVCFNCGLWCLSHPHDRRVWATRTWSMKHSTATSVHSAWGSRPSRTNNTAHFFFSDPIQDKKSNQVSGNDATSRKKLLFTSKTGKEGRSSRWDPEPPNPKQRGGSCTRVTWLSTMSWRVREKKRAEKSPDGVKRYRPSWLDAGAFERTASKSNGQFRYKAEIKVYKRNSAKA